jgi:hypothetical protein
MDADKPREIDARIAVGDLDLAHVPTFVDGNHWTLLDIELITRTFTYIDPKYHHAACPPNILDTFRWWLSGLLHGAVFGIEDPPHDVPQQCDSISCGPILLCILGTRHLSHSPWTQAAAALHRMLGFFVSQKCIKERMR